MEKDTRTGTVYWSPSVARHRDQAELEQARAADRALTRRRFSALGTVLLVGFVATLAAFLIAPDVAAFLAVVFQ